MSVEIQQAQETLQLLYCVEGGVGSDATGGDLMSQEINCLLGKNTLGWVDAETC